MGGAGPSARRRLFPWRRYWYCAFAATTARAVLAVRQSSVTKPTGAMLLPSQDFFRRAVGTVYLGFRAAPAYFPTGVRLYSPAQLSPRTHHFSPSRRSACQPLSQITQPCVTSVDQTGQGCPFPSRPPQLLPHFLRSLASEPLSVGQPLAQHSASYQAMRPLLGLWDKS